ncbi:MAG: Fe-S oxidoreductase [Deltaproteobacteria bacterium RBG_13_49_15]|nr:MAG: Fe-S oxidoreductase [Deltaproteobacteria bacterium RBG_13_49_15]
MNQEPIPLSIDDRFRFTCDKNGPCFNDCCRDLNQFLTPYDILRIKRRLGLSSSQFLERYAHRHIGPRSGFPIVSLMPNDPVELSCPFVTRKGCSIYQDRPTSCRLYPVARAVTRSRETEKITEHFALIKEPFCKGFDEGRVQTVREWITNQGASPYIRMNDLLMELIALKNRLYPGDMDLKAQRLFNLACYDIDGFRDHVKKGLLNGLPVNETEIQAAISDDEKCLELGHRWLKRVLFEGETTEL